MRSERWNDAFLESMREVGDPEADAVIGDVVAHHGIAHVNDLMRSLVQNDEIVTGDFPPAVRDYLAESATLPPWADMAMIERGEQFFDDNWPIIVTLLFCASLPSAYAAHKGAQVLHLTQRMTQHVHRRIFETAQFVLDVMAPDGLSRTDRGIRSAQKVRLMHSATRNIIEHDPRWRSQWNEAWGVPINQEDMAGTLMTFSLQVLVGMKRFRIEMDPEDEEAYLHAWKVVGHILGVDEALLPSDLEDAQLLATTIFERQKGSSEAGLELSAALLAFMQNQMPRRVLYGFPATLMRYSLEPGVADLLQIPPANWTALLFEAEEVVLRLLARLQLQHRQHSRLLQWLSFRLVQELVHIERGGNRSLFRIPPTLRATV